MPASRVQITRLQVIEPARARPAPTEQKVDQYVAGDKAWNQPAANSVPTEQPAALEERRAEIWSTPQGFVHAALANGAKVAKITRDGKSRSVSFTLDGKYRYEGELNAAGEVTRIRTWIDNPVLGDTAYESEFSDYRDFAGVHFPAHLVRRLGGFPILDLQVGESVSPA